MFGSFGSEVGTRMGLLARRRIAVGVEDTLAEEACMLVEGRRLVEVEVGEGPIC